MTQRTKVVQQVKIHIHIKFYVNQSNFQRVMGLAKTCVKGQKSVFSNITLSKKIVTRVKKASTFFLVSYMGIQINKIPCSKKSVDIQGVKSKMAAVEPLNSEKRHNFSSRRHIFTNKLSVYRFLGTRHLLTPTFMPKNDSFYRFNHILRKNMLCINLYLATI